MNLSDEVVDESHLGNENQTELEYQLAWARTYLKNYGVIVNSARSVWSITSNYTGGATLDRKKWLLLLLIRMQREERPPEKK